MSYGSDQGEGYTTSGSVPVAPRLLLADGIPAGGCEISVTVGGVWG